MKVKPRVLYLVYWGAAEPLGQSLVLPSVKKLAATGLNLTLITFEKSRDLERRQLIKEIMDSLGDCGIRWLPLRYHKRPKIPATALDVVQGCARSIATSLRSRPDIIHARTFIGGLMGLAVAQLLSAKLVYHNEGFYPDEQVDAGVWRGGSLIHRIAKRLERQMYARADGIIALSQRAKREIEAMGVVKRKGTPVLVAPSCVDLEHFKVRGAAPCPQDGVLRLVYSGSVGGRYELDKIAHFVKVAMDSGVRVHLCILSRAERGLVASILNGAGVPGSAWSYDSIPHNEMPEQLARSHAGLFFLTQGTSEYACSPTKIGEYWAAGLPVITTPVSDIEEVIRDERVGVIVRQHSTTDYIKAVQELRLLLKDVETPFRCRRAAEKHYSLESACESQTALYDSLFPGSLSKWPVEEDVSREQRRLL